MLVVVASAYDRRALSIAEHWGPQCSAMLTAEDLCLPGWILTVPRFLPDTAVIGGKTVSAAQIRGILTLRPCVFHEELVGIRSNHRQYVAAELNAFLLAWLTVQSCPVINRPTAGCLAGPNWRPEQWTHAAARLGIPAQTRRCVPDGSAVADPQKALEVIAAGERCFGCEDSLLRDRTVKLARLAGVDLLSVRFTEDGRFLSASTWPSLEDPAVLNAVRKRLECRP